MKDFFRNNSIFKNLFQKNSFENIEEINGTKVGTEESVVCRICNLKDKNQLLYNPCSCVGQSSFIHRNCLSVWSQRARYDVLCCECKARYIRIKYRQNSSFMVWLNEEPKVKRHVIIGGIAFPLIFAMVLFGCIKAASVNTGHIFKVLFVPTMTFGILSLWKFIGSLALVLKGYNEWKTSRLNTKCDLKHKTEEKDKQKDKSI